MKKTFFILLAVIVSFLSTVSLSGQNKEKELIKRKIAIFPFYNENNVEEFKYLENTIRDALKAKLSSTDLFFIANTNDIDNRIKNISKKDLVYNEESIVKTALLLRSDVVLTGKFIVIKDKVMIIAEAIDVLQKQSVTSSTVSGDTGVEIFTLIQTLADGMTEKMAKNFPKAEKTLIEELLENMQKEHNIKPETDAVKTNVKDTNPENNPEYRIYKRLLGMGIGYISAGTSTMIIFGIPFIAVGLSFYDFNTLYPADNILLDVLIGFGAFMTVFGSLFDIAAIIFFPIAAYYYKQWKSKTAEKIIISPIIQTSFNEFRLGLSIKI